MRTLARKQTRSRADLSLVLTNYMSKVIKLVRGRDLSKLYLIQNFARLARYQDVLRKRTVISIWNIMLARARWVVMTLESKEGDERRVPNIFMMVFLTAAWTLGLAVLMN